MELSNTDMAKALMFCIYTVQEKYMYIAINHLHGSRLWSINYKPSTNKFCRYFSSSYNQIQRVHNIDWKYTEIA